MIIAGTVLQGSEAIFALVNVDENKNFEHINVKIKKISLGDEQDSSAIHAFKEAVATFARENNISVFAIKERMKIGRMAGGGTTFKMEALIQLVENAECKFVHANTLASFIKKSDIEMPDSLLSYQKGAYFAAVREASISHIKSNL